MAAGKRILIVCPARPGKQYGNRIRSLRYQSLLRRLGHQPRIGSELSGRSDVLVVLHAFHGAAAIRESKLESPDRPVVLAITGTDLYRDGKTKNVHESLSLADRLIVSQPATLHDLPKIHRAKTHVIYQSTRSISAQRPKSPLQLRVIVAGHLRPVKDPFRAAFAVRKIPATSKIVVEHYGRALDARMKKLAMEETKQISRYKLRGEIRRGELRRRIATSWLLVLSSKMEGGPNVLSESIANGTPILASNISGSRGMLGDDYQGYFNVGDTANLRKLLLRCETDPRFYETLRRQVTKLKHLVQPARELASWKKLLRSL